MTRLNATNRPWMCATVDVRDLWGAGQGGRICGLVSAEPKRDDGGGHADPDRGYQDRHPGVRVDESPDNQSGQRNDGEDHEQEEQLPAQVSHEPPHLADKSGRFQLVAHAEASVLRAEIDFYCTLTVERDRLLRRHGSLHYRDRQPHRPKNDIQGDNPERQPTRAPPLRLGVA